MKTRSSLIFTSTGALYDLKSQIFVDPTAKTLVSASIFDFNKFK